MEVLVEPWHLRRCRIIRCRRQKDTLLTIAQFNCMNQCQVGLLLCGMANDSSQGPKMPSSWTGKNPPIHLSRRYRERAKTRPPIHLSRWYCDEKQRHNNIQTPYAPPPCKRRETMVDCWVGAQQRRGKAMTWPPWSKEKMLWMNPSRMNKSYALYLQ